MKWIAKSDYTGVENNSIDIIEDDPIKYNWIATVHTQFEGKEAGEKNAALIAAAPDLLEALTSLYTKFRNDGLGASHHYSPILEMAKAAIQKATSPIKQHKSPQSIDLPF